MHETWLDTILEMEMTGGPEDRWYAAMEVFMPPPELRSKRPGFDDLVHGFKLGKSEDNKAKRQVEKSIRASWETNRTFYAIDPKTKRAEFGYMDEGGTSMSSLKSLYNIVNDVTPGGYPEIGFKTRT